MIKFVGMTGGIASGKSTASAVFASQGVEVVDADDVGHTLYEARGKAVGQIQRELGSEFINEDGSVDRDLLRAAVFADSAVRKRLEAVTHPLIRRECMLRMRAATGVYGLLVAPLLLESEFMLDQIERVLVVDCSVDDQIRHGVARGRFSEQQIRSAIKAQMRRENRLRRADDVIHNDGDIEKLKGAVQQMHEKYVAELAGKTEQ